MTMDMQRRWNEYWADPGFRRYVAACRNFDSAGFERAIQNDEAGQCFEFRQVIIEAYSEDRAAGALHTPACG